MWLPDIAQANLSSIRLSPDVLFEAGTESTTTSTNHQAALAGFRLPPGYSQSPVAYRSYCVVLQPWGCSKHAWLLLHMIMLWSSLVDINTWPGGKSVSDKAIFNLKPAKVIRLPFGKIVYERKPTVMCFRLWKDWTFLEITFIFLFLLKLALSTVSSAAVPWGRRLAYYIIVLSGSLKSVLHYSQDACVYANSGLMLTLSRVGILNTNPFIEKSYLTSALFSRVHYNFYLSISRIIRTFIVSLKHSFLPKYVLIEHSEIQ